MKLLLCLSLSAAVWQGAASAQVRIAPGSEKIRVEIGGKPFTDFYVAGAGLMKPYLHPLRAAFGTYVTRMWPMENVAEEAKAGKDHLHQRGLWFAHEAVNGLDFWNTDASYTTPNRGKMVLKKLPAVKSGKEQGSIAATFDWADLADHVQLTETRVTTFYDDPRLRTIDFDITLTAVLKVVFGDSKDSAFGLRLRPVLQEDHGTGHIVNSDGGEGEKQTWGKPANWCDYSGEIAGEKLGIAILDHPANPHHPARWHVRGYGLFAANPFGLASYTNDKSQDGSITVQPGESLRFRYRVIIHPGDAKTADVAGLWRKYTGGK